MTGRKRDVWELCQHDEALAQLVRDFGMEGALVGIEVEANGQRAYWGKAPCATCGKWCPIGELIHTGGGDAGCEQCPECEAQGPRKRDRRLRRAGL